MAATNTTRFSDQQYRNWLKATLYMLYLKEALERIVDTDAVKFYQGLQKAIGVFGATPKICFNCTQNDMRKDFGQQKWWMKCSLCDQWLQQIVQTHADQPLPSLHTENTDPQRWSTNPYEVFKCYMPYGCQKDRSAADGDVQSILKLIQNCLYFNTRDRIGRLDLVDTLLEIRNSLFHSGNFLVADHKLKTDMQTMLDFLGGMKALSVEEENAVDKAIDKIKQLQDNKIDLSLNRELELQALQQQQIALGKDLGSHITKLSTAITSATAKSSATELDIKKLREETKGLEQHKQQVEGLQDQFRRFLQANGLEEDLARLSTAIDKQGQTVEEHAKLLSGLENASGNQKNQLQSQQATLEDYDTRFQSHDTSLADLGAQLKSIQEKLATIKETGNDTGQMAEADIADLQKALIKHYRSFFFMVPNPVNNEKFGLDNIYVPTHIKVLRETKNSLTGIVNVKDRATPANASVCKQLFCTEDYRSKNVYVTGDAGMGKTMFSKHLINIWCRAQNDQRAGTSTGSDSADSGQHTEPSDCVVREFDESNSDDSPAEFHCSFKKFRPNNLPSDFEYRTVDFTKDDISTMSNFQLLFYITPRNSLNRYEIVEMIDAQILRNIKFKKTLKAFDILQNEGCLVIIDGLDEWACPDSKNVPHYVNSGIPGRMHLNSNTVYLTTTRPWKFDVLNLNGFDVDKHVELKGLNEKSSKQLCSKVTRLLSSCENVTKARNIWAELIIKDLSCLHNVPVILTQLIYLFSDKQELGNSKVELYCSIIEMLLKRPDKGQTLTVAQNTVRSEKLLPECFSKYRSCQAHQHVLVTLAKIAFEAIFNGERENSLVFESSQMTIFGVDQEDIDLCLKTGILSQNKVLGKMSVCEKRMSFLHKKLQQFLAAIFIKNSEGEENVLSRVESYCSTEEKISEISQIRLFVSGLNGQA